MNHWTVRDDPLFDSSKLLCHAFRSESDKQIIKLIGGYNLSDLPASRPAVTKFHPKASLGRAE